MSAVSIQGFSYSYPGAARPALTDVSLELEPGELVVLAGASGSGKSTLLRAISGLVPHFYGGSVSGRAVVGGIDTREHGPGELAREVGTLFQDPETQVVMGTVRAELSFPLENRGEGEATLARGVEEVALALAIDQLLERSTAELSGGELQRVALGATLAGRPSVVVLDEPTSQLDPVAGDELIGLLRRLNEDSDLTIVLAEHRLERCLAAADRVVALVDGRAACDASPVEFLEWALVYAPALATPGARLLSGLGLKPTAAVKGARASLRAAGFRDSHEVSGPTDQKAHERRGALTFEHVWHELRNGPAILKGVSLEVHVGDRVALMGRNGAGKSTLLRHAAGLMEPTRGKVSTAGRVALLLQNPNDYLIHDTVGEEATAGALRQVGLDPSLIARHPRDLSGGEKQRLALAIVLGDPTEPPAVLALDEPTRGMDRTVKDDLAELLKTLAETGTGVLVATHDPEFVAAFADRVILMGDGDVIADGPTHEILGGGTYFATETARILNGAALTPAEGIALLTRTEVPAT